MMLVGRVMMQMNRRLKRVFLCVALVAGVLASGVAQETAAAPDVKGPGRMGDWRPIFQGIELRDLASDKPRMMRGYAMRIDLKAPGIEFIATPGNGDAPGETTSTFTTTFLEKEHVQAAVNAAPFNLVKDEEGSAEDVLGLMISKGEVVSPEQAGYPSLMFTKDNRVSIAESSGDRKDIFNAVSGFQIVLTNGEVRGTDQRFAPRTAAGVTEDGRYLLLLVIDGRQTDWSIGATTPEVGAWLKALGAREGINLDGGGTTTMAVENLEGKAEVINRTIHKNIPGNLRPSGSHLGIYAKRLAPANSEAAPKVPGVVIDHSLAATRQYIGSPSIVILPNGEYLASHDLFGPGSTKRHTRIFGSSDRGESWKKRAEIDGQWWSSLFVNRGAVYTMGTSAEYGFAVIRRSDDGGKTWTTPVDAGTGVLHGDGKYHTAPVPVVVHAGRIWRAMEDAQGPGGWGDHFRAFMMSAPEDADLLKAENWTGSNRIGKNKQWLGGAFGGWLEGNAVVTPEGGIVDLLRVDTKKGPEEKAAIVRISADGKEAAFDPGKDFFDFPGGCKKFTIRYDEKTKLYWSLTNWVPENERGGDPAKTRNTLALISSADLRDWKVRSVILHHPDAAVHGFQYVDWQFDGEDLIAAVRTAFDDGFGGAHNQHDADFMTFQRVRGFRR